MAEDPVKTAVTAEEDHRLEQEVAVRARTLRDAPIPIDGGGPVVAEPLCELLVDERPDPLGDELDGTLDALVVRNCHYTSRACWASASGVPATRRAISGQATTSALYGSASCAQLLRSQIE